MSGEKRKMPTRNYDLLENIRQKASMSKQIVSRKDSEYAYYVGGSFEVTKRMAIIDTMLKAGMIPEPMILLVKLYRSYLDQQRKAFFASVGSTEITKLGFLLGLSDDSISAT